jgi:hypothetical protein
MLDPALLSTIKPMGLDMVVEDLPKNEEEKEFSGIKIVGTDRRFYKATVSGKLRNGEYKTTTVNFSLPISAEGVFTVAGLHRFIIPQGIVDVEAYHPNEPLNFYFINRGRVLMRALAGIFHRVFTDFFMEQLEPSDLTLQNEIDSWFKSSPDTREVTPTRIGLNSMKEMVLLHVPDEGLDVTSRHFSKRMFGVVDPASTPAGEKVNVTYRLAKGADVLSGVNIPGKSIFCSTIEDHHLPVALCPRRTHIVRSAYENSIQLDEKEIPVVGNPGLPGRHLLTAVMRLRTYTGDDAIVISRSAAVKLRATRKVTEQFYVKGALHLKVKEGDEILPRAVLARSADPITQEEEIFYTKSVKGPATVESITAVNSSYFNIPAKRVRVVCASTADAQSGDKVITRSGIKGVIRVLDDNLMPKMKDGQVIECIISPESIVNRRAMSFYWEGMVGELILSLVNSGMTLEEARAHVSVNHLNPRPSFEELVQRGFGEGHRLIYHGQELPEETYVANIFIIRLNKIAHEIVSFHHGKVNLNGMKLPINSAAYSGQKRDFAKAAALRARGMDSTLSTFIKDNAEAKFAFTELTKVLTGVETPILEGTLEETLRTA